MIAETALRAAVPAVERIDAELERSRRKLAAVLGRTEALAELRQVAIELEDDRNDGKPPRARRSLTFEQLLDVRGDEETRARVAALTERIASDEEEP